MLCPDYIAPLYLIISSQIPPLIYYSHIPAILLSLVIGSYAYISKKTLSTQFLLALSVIFSLWSFADLILWTNNSSVAITLFWTLMELMYVLITILTIYLSYSFIDNKLPGKFSSLLILVLASPLFFIIPTSLNIKEFDLSVCGISHQGQFFVYYEYLFSVFIFLWIFIYATKRYFQKPKGQGKQILLFTLGIEAFLLLLFTSGFIATYLVENGFIQDFGLEQYSMLGMMVFIGLLAYMMVRFHTFKAKVFGAQALVGLLWVALGSLLFIAETETARIIVAGTEIIAIIFGLFLIGSVKKEIKQKEQIEKLVGDLQSANVKLKALDKQKTEFLSFASHQLRSPVTAIKGYASMILEGSFGELNKGAKGAVDVIFQSAQRLVFVIEDFLNVTRIELGTMKFDFAETDLKQIVDGVVATMKLIANAHNLTLTEDIDGSKDYTINIDPGKISQVVSNLVDNAIKYTDRKGSVYVSLVNQKDKMRIEVKDTGVGIDKETLNRLFQKFSRADDANKMNANGTGLGLYVAKQLVEAHKGKLWAESEGLGKGTTFIVELPVKR